MVVGSVAWLFRGPGKLCTTRGGVFNQRCKENYFDVDSGEYYWISGVRRNGNDALYPMTIQIDEDVREEYWMKLRRRADLADLKSFRSPGKHRK